MTEGLVVELDGPAATLWLDREHKRNAVTAAMWTAIPGVVAGACEDPSVRVLVVRGRGTHFCAGADITELGASLASDDDGVGYRAMNSRAEAAIRDAPIVTLAAIDGSCMGGGVQLALACDLRVATRRSRLGITAGRLGITYPAPSLERLVEVVGAGTARRLLVTAEVLEAEEASQLGLVDRVVDDDGLDAAVLATVSALAATSAVTQLAAKQMVAEVARDGSVPAALAAAWERRASTSADLAEGLEAFGAGRAPRFGPRPAPPDR